MNGTEQRRQRWPWPLSSRKTVAEKVDRHAADVQFVLERFDERLFDLATKAQETRRDVNSVKVDVAMLKHELADRDDRHVTFKAEFIAFRYQGFWGRLRWLFTGR